MLKISLDDNLESQQLICVLRGLIRSDISFIAANVSNSFDFETCKGFIDQRIGAFVVEGFDNYHASFTGMLVHSYAAAVNVRSAFGEAESEIFLEAPFVFNSLEESVNIWPHKTLEDRIIDASLFALAGYAMPVSVNKIYS